jgi:hypothetical protein
VAEITHNAGIFRLQGARALADAAPKAFAIVRQIEAIETAIETSPGLAIDLCRGLLETVCKTILNDLGETISADANADQMVSAIRKRFSIFVEPESVEAKARKPTKQTVSGIANFVSGVSEYRRLFGIASHGKDGYDDDIDGMHAALVAGVTDSLVIFLYRMHRRQHGFEEWARATYGDHTDFDQYLDDEHDPSPILVFGDEHRPSSVLFQVNKTGYIRRLNDWRELVASGEVAEDVDQ